LEARHAIPPAGSPAAKKVVLPQTGLLAFIALRPRLADGILTLPLGSSDRVDGHSRRVPAAGDDQNS
jgi:hypothetical protein